MYNLINFSQVAQWGNNPPVMQETQETTAYSLGWEDALEKEMATHSSILGKSHGQRAWRTAVLRVVTSDTTGATAHMQSNSWWNTCWLPSSIPCPFSIFAFTTNTITTPKLYYTKPQDTTKFLI